MPHELSKSYEPGAIEKRWAEYWVKEKLFSVPTPPPGSPTAQKPVFTLLLPPPNVTGRLHMGHMLNQTQMDIIVRWHRMRGFLTLWLPGTDHAGIATQMMVERQLAKEGKNRHSLGREGFVERVWEWRREYGGAILDQMKRLGASVDWSREYFTMDENLSRAVREVFVRLYDEGLIYRGKYIVNWCPRCGTAISDLEVKHEETPGKLYEIRYPVVGAKKEFITVATTRPETMLGDTAVAVNAADERYKHLHGKRVLLPLMDREIPIILDELANPEFGTGAVKVTPAHDANDFQAGLRHQLPQIDVMDERGYMNDNAGAYAGLERFEAREAVLRDLRTQGLLAGEKDYVVPIGKCDRCGTIVEPRLSTQWFMAMTKAGRDGSPSLAQRAIEVVENGSIRFTPDNYRRIFLQWMNNIYDWCISRQLWWGHRIPAWYCGNSKCREIVVARETPTKCPKCGGTRLEQETDVLDTWFSSGLLPFTTLGWPEKTHDQEVFYPTSLMVTAYEILFFWVARMVMFGCHFMDGHRQDPALKQVSGFGGRKDDSVPFREVYIHALVRDAERQKMSKTKGNVLDPIQVIEQYGTDATRFTLAAMASPGTDIAFNPKRTEGYRAFANKIWNAARFIFMNVDRAQQAGVWSLQEFVGAELRSAQTGAEPRSHTGIAGFHAATLEDRWILSRFNAVATELNQALETYRFDEAANRVYDFFWGEFCDWYVELLKPRLAGENGDQAAARAAFGNIVGIFEGALRMLHPFMPFITEEIWHAIYHGKPPVKSIALVEYPAADPAQRDLDAETEMAILQDLIVSVRNLRAELKVESRQRVPIQVHAVDGVRQMIEHNRGAVERLATVENLEFVETSLAKAGGVRATSRFEVRVVYEQKIDEAAERARLQKELEGVEREMENKRRQLKNDAFLQKAPPHVVEGLRKRLAELEVLQEKIQRALDHLR
ncbi:MAG TPA: valine--tRNA ligase [Terriglobales bacterium]|nr:valine--tRNA ligase [Terriglobales bacterium]